MLTLAIDTAAAACQACVHDSAGDRIAGRCVEIIGRGHAERLMAVIDAALADASTELSAIDRLAVTVGPGSFTGIRVGVATVRGLALALGCDAVGVETLEAVGAFASLTAGGPVLAVIDARRGEVYGQLFDAAGAARGEPAAMTPEQAARLARDAGAALAGSGAALIAEGLAGEAMLPVVSGAETVDIATVARIAASRAGPFGRPAPLYLRGADAKPQAGFAVARRQ